MQDEVTKHTKKIYKTIKNKEHTVGEKIKETIIEIFIIVFAVTLSIWLHGWSEQRHEQKEVTGFLTGLKKDLGEDIRLLDEYKRVSLAVDSNFKFLLGVKGKIPGVGDTAILTHLNFETRTTHPQIGRYQGFKSSGKIGNIENDVLKQDILTFYEQTIPDLVDGEEITNNLQLKIMDLQIDRADNIPISSFILSKKIRSLLGVGTQNFHSNIEQYSNAVALAKKIIAEIDKEENE